MRKLFQITTLLCIGTFALMANNTIYEENCKSCHNLKPMMDKAQMMSMMQMMMSPEKKEMMKAKMAKMKKMMQDMKAPPLSKVSAKLKFDFKNDKTAFVAFVKDYMLNPSSTKSHCMPMAIEKFGVMPAVGKSMSNKDLDAIANWLYDNFTDVWNPKMAKMMSKMCNKSPMKNNDSKCGASHKKENNGKCGEAEEKSSMKCGNGKCGSN